MAEDELVIDELELSGVAEELLLELACELEIIGGFELVVATLELLTVTELLLSTALLLSSALLVAVALLESSELLVEIDVELLDVELLGSTELFVEITLDEIALELLDVLLPSSPPHAVSSPASIKKGSSFKVRILTPLLLYKYVVVNYTITNGCLYTCFTGKKCKDLFRF